MKNIFAAATVSLALALPSASASNAGRDLQIVASDWAMNNPTITYDGPTETFTVTVGHGNIPSGEVLLQYWGNDGTTGSDGFDGCPHGEPPANPHAQNIGSPSWLTKTGPATVSTGLLGKTSTWTFKVKPGVASTVYYKAASDGQSATLAMCLKAALKKDTGTAGDPTVNFREMIVTIDYDLLSGFSFTSFQTAALDPTTDSLADITFATTVNDCSAGTQPYNQGEVICIQVCVTTTNALMKVSKFKKMRVKALPDTTPDEDGQQIWQDDNQIGELTIGESPNGNCLQTTFMLRGNFFPFAESENLPSNNKVTGTVYLQATRRRLDGKEVRVLEEATSDFSTVIKTNPTVGSGAGALGGVSAAGVLGAAALLL